MADPKPHYFTCPGCGLYGPSETFAADDENKAYAHLLGEIGNRQIAASVEHYLGLFRPRQRRITAKRAQALLAELVPMITSATINRDGREWSAPAAAWLAGIDEMLRLRDAKKLDLPMQTHGYLLELLVRQANRVEGKVENQCEQARQLDSRDRGTQHSASFDGEGHEKPIGDIVATLIPRTGPDGLPLAPGQRPNESQADYFKRKRGE